MEDFNKELAKFLSKLMDAQGLQDHEKVLTIWVKNLGPTVKKMNNTKSLMIDMKPEDATKLDTVPLDIQKKPYYLRMVYTDVYISLTNNTETKKRLTTDFIWNKNTYRLDRIVQELGSCIFYYLQDGPDRDFMRKELMHVSEDTQVPPDWGSEWK